MKKATSIMVFITILSTNIIAQTEKGQKIIGGSLSFLSDSKNEKFKAGSSSEDKRLWSDIDLMSGMFIKDQFAVGLNLGQEYIKDDLKLANDKTTTTRSEFSIGLFGRYYKMTKIEKFGFIFHFSGNFIGGSGTNKSVLSGLTTNTKSKIAGMGLSFTPGITYFISEHFAAETFYGNLGFTSLNEKVKSGSTEFSTIKENNFDLDFTMHSLHYGFSYFF